jgi:general secretion pathway protein D
MMRRISNLPAVLVLLATLVGCAAQRSYDEGMSLVQSGQVSEGLAKIDEAYRLDPDSQQYRQAYFRQKEVALQRQLAIAEAARQQGLWDGAKAAYEAMQAIDRNNARARAGLESLALERRQRDQVLEAESAWKEGDLAGAQMRLRAVLAENPAQREARLLLRRIDERVAAEPLALSPKIAEALRQPMKLEFRDTSLRQVFDAISKATGIDVIFDKDAKLDGRVTLLVRNSSIDDVMRYLLVTNQLERRVLANNLLLIYPNTAAKQREYQELIAKTFYISNADVKVIANMLRTVVKSKDLHIDEKLNAIVLRDTPDAIRMAERLVANMDLAEAEVMLEVEVLEVGSSDLTSLGLKYPDQLSVSLVGAAGTAGTLTLPEWRGRNAGLVRLSFTNPLLALNFSNTVGRSNLLANPRIRVKNKSKAKVHIGDKVPVITTTTTSTGFASESVTYLDVGLKLDVEPVISLEDEVGMTVGLEVSNIVREVRSPSGGLTYQVGIRNAATTLRLRDGETQVLAGLISDEDRKSIAQVPGVGNLPIVGRLFGNHQDTSSKTEIVLLITPRVLRNIDRPQARFAEFASGTEAAIGASPLALQAVRYADPAPSGAVRAAGGTRTEAGTTTDTPAKAAPQLVLQGPGGVIAGQAFTVQMMLDAQVPLRSGLFDLAFDPSRLRFVRAEPGALVSASDKGATLRVNAPDGLGRLSVSLTGTAPGAIRGSGDLVRFVFEALPQAVGSPSIRLEAATLTDASGQVTTVAAPPAVTLSVAR